MANPLETGSHGGGQAISLRAWCNEQNVKPLFERMERWYFVIHNDGVDRIDSLSGTDANNVRKMLDGRLEDFAGWSPKRMDGYRRWLWSVAEKGLVDPPRPRAIAYEREAAE